MPDIAGLGDDDDVTIVPQFTRRRTPVAPGEDRQLVATTHIPDEDWDRYQAWKASQGKKGEVARGSNMALSEFVNIQVEALENMPPNGHPVGINGTCYIIKPGVPQRVPRSIIEILRNAKIGMPVRDPTTQRVLRYEDRLRLPFTILPDDEAEAA